MDTYYLGIDVGSVSINLVVTNRKDNILEKLYLKTMGQPINVLCEGLKTLGERLGGNRYICGVGATGSGRQLAGVISGADIVKNEITTHAVAAQKTIHNVKTVMEIGGQDSKIIMLKNGIVCDFAMNTVCAAGTGSFLDRQAERLGIPIEKFGEYALRSVTPVRIAGRCAVFAESDMIHKQQAGHKTEDIICGLCEGLVRNYLNNLVKGKRVDEPIVFQGGVAANVGIVAAFEKALGMKVVIPKYYDVMGAYGAALIAKDYIEQKKKAKDENNGVKKLYKNNIELNSELLEKKERMSLDCKEIEIETKTESTAYEGTKFKGFETGNYNYSTRNVQCNGCSNMCEIVEILSEGDVIARWGDRCGNSKVEK